MKKSLIFIFLFFLFLLLTLSLFVIGKKIISGYIISKENKTEYVSTTAASPSDKDKGCFILDSGRVVCKVATIEISEGSVREDNFKVEIYEN